MTAYAESDVQDLIDALRIALNKGIGHHLAWVRADQRLTDIATIAHEHGLYQHRKAS